MKAIEIRGLSFTYPDGTTAIKNLNLNIHKGKRVAILGANGSGKTTLLYHLNGLILPQKGTIKIFNKLVCKDNIKAIRQKVGLLFDNPDNQLFSTTVYNDIAFGPRNLKLDEKTINDNVNKAMAMVDIMNLKDKTPYNLSLGQKKRVAIAGILAMGPELLLFDEPFSGLDPCSNNQFLKILNDLYNAGCTMIISTHDVDIAYKWADDVIILNKGDLIAEGPVNLLQDKALMEKASLQIPTLAKVFAGTGFNPRSEEEANRILTGVLKNETSRRSYVFGGP